LHGDWCYVSIAQHPGEKGQSNTAVLVLNRLLKRGYHFEGCNEFTILGRHAKIDLNMLYFNLLFFFTRLMDDIDHSETLNTHLLDDDAKYG
jgi:hypothetical protein